VLSLLASSSSTTKSSPDADSSASTFKLAGFATRGCAVLRLRFLRWAGSSSDWSFSASTAALYRALGSQRDDRLAMKGSIRTICREDNEKELILQVLAPPRRGTESVIRDNAVRP
jgi:hypothetical protein